MKVTQSPFVIGALALATFVAPLSIYAQGNELNHGQDTPADGRGDRIRGVPPRASTGGAVTTGNGINYHNGPVLHTINLYYILYGNWAQTNVNPTGTSLLTAWGNSIGGSPYFNINTTYGDTSGNVPNAVTLYPVSYSDTGSLGAALSDSSIATLVSNAINSGKLGAAGVADPNGLYMVLTAPGVNETSGFLTQYCGWHSWGSWGTTPVQYAFVGDAAGPSLGNCAQQTAKSPNGDPGVDAMISVMAHELEETATDPQGTGWYASNGEENGDLCAWNFGATYTAPNGSLANMVLGGRNYLIQENWLNGQGGKCVLSWASTPDFSISASPSTIGVAKGSSAPSTISVAGLNGFTGDVNLSISACPAALSCSLNAAKVTLPPDGSSTLTVGASSGTPAGSYAVSVTGTGSSGTHSTSVTVNVPDYTLSASPSSLSVQLGQSKNSTITVSSLGRFNNAVYLTVSGCPTNATCTLPGPVTPPANGSGSSTLTVATSSTTPAGAYTVTITGNDPSHTTTVLVTVTAPSDFGISVSPTSITITRGSSGSVTLSTTVTGAASSVALSLTGLPNRTNYSFTPSSVTAGGSSTLTITINRSASKGTYPLTITGNNGTFPHSTPLSLIIN